MKTFYMAFSVVRLVLLATCSCCLSQLHGPPGRFCASYFFMFKRDKESFKHKQGKKKKYSYLLRKKQTEVISDFKLRTEALVGPSIEGGGLVIDNLLCFFLTYF